MPLLKNAILSQKESLRFTADTGDKKFPDRVKVAMETLSLHLGYTGFLIQDFAITYSSNGSVDMKIHYFQSAKESKAVEDAALQWIAKNLQSSQTDLEKLILIHDFVINSVHYDYTYKNRSPYLAWKEKKAVCTGFALLGGRLLELAGCKQMYVTGDSTDPNTRKTDKHIWNKVHLRGHWYNVDFTWDSCCKTTNPYIYFCVTDSQLFKSHRPLKTQTGIPKSTDKPFFKQIDIKTLTEKERKILPFVSPGLMFTKPQELTSHVKKTGVYSFSLPLSTHLNPFLSSALQPLSAMISGYEAQTLENNVLGVLQVKLTIHGRKTG